MNDAKSVAKRNRRKYRLTLWLFIAWAATNVLIWYWPQWTSAMRDFWKRRQLEQISSHYENHVHVFSGDKNERLGYSLLRPQVADQKRYPLVVCLHGSGARGTDMLRHLGSMGKIWIQPEIRQRYPCYVLIPQCPLHRTWLTDHPMDMQQAIFQLIDQLSVSCRVDLDRVYVVGYSMGGYGAWHIAARQPDRFAAVLAVAGGGDPEEAGKLAQVPIWAVHGDHDGVVQPQKSIRMVKAIQEAGGHCKMSLMHGVRHNSWQVVQDKPEAYLDWMYEQNLARRASGRSRELQPMSAAVE